MSDTQSNANEIYAYVLMRDDLASLGAGKAAAHAHHAGTQMIYHIRKYGNDEQKTVFNRWIETASGAGTTIVLSCSEEIMKVCVHKIKELADQGCSAGVWHDPTYPSTTKMGFCLMPVDVCGWAIGSKDLLKSILGELPLMNNSRWQHNDNWK